MAAHEASGVSLAVEFQLLLMAQAWELRLNGREIVRNNSISGQLPWPAANAGVISNLTWRSPRVLEFEIPHFDTGVCQGGKHPGDPEAVAERTTADFGTCPPTTLSAATLVGE